MPNTLDSVSCAALEYAADQLVRNGAEKDWVSRRTGSKYFRVPSGDLVRISDHKANKREAGRDQEAYGGVDIYEAYDGAEVA